MRGSTVGPARARVGCSGWIYTQWRGDFYPSDLPVSAWFAFYAARFDTVEINNSFYRLPEPATFDAWRAMAPRGFVFSVKASRYLTHMKKLKDPAEPLDRFFSHARHLRSRLGPVLYQLPPRWGLDLDRLQRFLDTLPRRRRHVIEFRDPSWYVDRVFDALERRGVALCLHDMAGSATGRLEVGPFVYVRFHGTTTYGGRYPDDRLG
ncbi:MAG: DUF72 domain-containing protein, partial [Vicinamibacterales bacterium]